MEDEKTTQVTENSAAAEPKAEETNNELEAKLAEAEARAAKAEADVTRFKASIDKLTKEAAEKKREERAKLSEDERLAAEREEEIAKLREKADADARELNHLKAISAYKEISDLKTVEDLIEAIANQDHASIMQIISDECDKAVKTKEAEWKASRPQGYVGSGSYPKKTKEEIFAIKDEEEMAREIARNKELFDL